MLGHREVLRDYTMRVMTTVHIAVNLDVYGACNMTQQ